MTIEIKLNLYKLRDIEKLFLESFFIHSLKFCTEKKMSVNKLMVKPPNTNTLLFIK